MSAPNFSTSSTKILPVVYSSGLPVLMNNVFSEEPLYEVISGPFAGRRGMRYELETLCESAVVVAWSSAVSCETGDILVQVKQGYYPALGLVL